MAGFCLRFDRGTVLCPRWPAGFDLALLPGLRWDARVNAYRAPAQQYANLCSALRALRFELDDQVPRRDQPLPLALPELRPYQQAALGAWQTAGQRGLVVLPTGSGKTRVAMAAIAAVARPTLCLVPTRVLLEQWRRELHATLELPVGCLGDGERDVQALTVATFESAYRQMPAIGDRFALLVVDEAHHFGRGLRDEALEMAVAESRLGLTATPPLSAHLESLLGPVVFSRTIEDLQGVWLAELERLELTQALTSGEQRAYELAFDTFRLEHDRFRALAPGGTFADFTRWAVRQERGRLALAAWQQARRIAAWNAAKSQTVGTLLRQHHAERTLVFTADAETAYEVARTHLIMPITGQIGRVERQAALRAFRSGELRALVAARVLNEGLDVPDASVGIIVGGALGWREHVQRIGRLLRPAPGKRALVYELVARGTHEVGQARRRQHGLPGC